MSLILDALRKSEAERRRGQAPSLYSGLPTPSTRRRPTALRFAPWVAAAVLVLVALFAFRPDHAPATKAELTDASEGDDASAPIPPTVDDSAASMASTTASAPAATAITPAPVATAPSKPAPNVDALVKPAALPASPAPAMPAPAPRPMPAPPPIAPAPAAADDSGEDLPPLAVLDTSTRNALPPLKLSMHFYNTDPERRFAIIDGHRVTEGSELGAAVVVEIRRDGVVLDVNGRRVLLPRP